MCVCICMKSIMKSQFRGGIICLKSSFCGNNDPTFLQVAATEWKVKSPGGKCARNPSIPFQSSLHLFIRIPSTSFLTPTHRLMLRLIILFYVLNSNIVFKGKLLLALAKLHIIV